MRYLDDCLLFVEGTGGTNTRDKVLKVFKEKGRGLSFTSKVPREGSIQFLDLVITTEHEHTCWRYSPRSVKPILDFRPDPSKLVKDGITTSCMCVRLA
ncbi:hypothetical protein HPB52_006446 [Rhipicephalus sanguineus]|uniref:Tick transposon n=1 Tax=Rhipicephalus sanguineus TaxID=34632 RepID=A0A9D4T336_RHISA|nr:hypothetical protein HPB52_006446 [Rhipicephalus sanguineus]